MSEPHQVQHLKRALAIVRTGDRESALADLSKLEEQLERRVDPQADAKQAALDALARAMVAEVRRIGGSSQRPGSLLVDPSPRGTSLAPGSSRGYGTHADLPTHLASSS